MNKEKQIRRFIDEFHPTYKELALFCWFAKKGGDYMKTAIHARMVAHTYTLDEVCGRGWYSTNITDWKNFNRSVEVKDGRYYLTKSCKKHNTSLYQPTYKELRERVERVRNNRRDYSRSLKEDCDAIMEDLEYIKDQIKYLSWRL